MRCRFCQLAYKFCFSRSVTAVSLVMRCRFYLLAYLSILQWTEGLYFPAWPSDVDSFCLLAKLCITRYSSGMALIRSFIHQIGHEMQILSASLKVLLKQVFNCCELDQEMQIEGLKSLIESLIHQHDYEMQILSACLKVLLTQVFNWYELGQELQILSFSFISLSSIVQ